MTKIEFQKLLADNYAKSLEIMKKKNVDYAGDGDPFKNFRTVENFGISLEQGILVRMSDKISRIGNLLLTTAQVKDESIEDTLIDLMGYSNIMLVALQNKKKE